MVKLTVFFSFVNIATGIWICAQSRTPFDVCGRNDQYSYPGKILMFTGGLLLTSGVIAIFESVKVIRLAMVVLMSAISSVLLLETAAGATAIALSLSLPYGFFNISLTQDLEGEFGKKPHVTLCIDHMQARLRCCGVKGQDDWEKSYWYRSENRNGTRPPSCCKEMSVCDVFSAYKKGCGDVSFLALDGYLGKVYTCAFVCVLLHMSSYMLLTFLEGKT